MKKKIFLLSIIATFVAFGANAQFGKALKNIGKTVASATGNVAGELALDAAANTLSANIAVWLDNNNTVAADDSPYTTRLATIVGEKYVNVDGLALNYKVYENPEFNILALPDGYIRVYSGLLDALESDDEVLALITTQIGHIVNKDARGNLLKAANKGQINNAATAQLEKLLTLSGEKLGTFVNEWIQVPYTDEQNKAADKYAATLLKKNDKSADALVSILTKLSELEIADTKAAQSEEADTEISPAYKYNRVNANNELRVSLVKSY
ncbi:MAG: M48 family metalloprotease [Dysgonamonadaceae bacterium]|jgi:putative metalloprotease|nr:M48 family metalloprotease [Dysgonamonadaceae bacterium]